MRSAPPRAGAACEVPSDIVERRTVADCAASLAVAVHDLAQPQLEVQPAPERELRLGAPARATVDQAAERRAVEPALLQLALRRNEGVALARAQPPCDGWL